MTTGSTCICTISQPVSSKNPITTGDGNVVDIVQVDESDRTIYFIGQGREPDRDPYFRHLYKVERSTAAGWHSVDPGERESHSVDAGRTDDRSSTTYSTPTTPPVSVLRDLRGPGTGRTRTRRHLASGRHGLASADARSR